MLKKTKVTGTGAHRADAGASTEASPMSNPKPRSGMKPVKTTTRQQEGAVGGTGMKGVVGAGPNFVPDAK